MRVSIALAALAALFTTGFVAPHALAQSSGAPVVEISHVSGKPVPRFEALRFEAVNGRLGPSEDHRILWRYERVGLPVLIIKETRNWRRVRDPGGDEVWMHARTLAPAETALLRTRAVVYASPDEGARAVADIEAGVLVQLGPCRDGLCEIAHERHEGWVEQGALWGAELTAPITAPQG